jgi:hypothetical protein
MTNILDVIGTDLKAAEVWVEKEAGVVLTEAQMLADTALKDIWSVGGVLFTAGEATATAAVLNAIKTFLSGLAPGQDLATIETAFLNEAETLGAELLTQAKGLGSMLLQALIALALKSIP